jgi:activator of HSP90 ATPase
LGSLNKQNLENSAMQSTHISRRSLALGLAAFPVGLVIAAESPAAPKAKSVAAVDGLSHSSEAIRQEILLDASPQRIYHALTAAEDFEMISRLSDAAVLLNAAGAKPTSISTEVGGPFTLFGGYVTGRHIEMLPNERLVQAWHAGSWKPDDFSIADFQLIAEGSKTRLKFEHRGFPNGNGVSLAQGWHSHYWKPLAKFLAQG